MNILVVCHYHYQGISVPTSLFVHAQMKEFVRQGHRVRVVVPVPIGKECEDRSRFNLLFFQKTVDGIEHVFIRHLSVSNFGNKGINDKLAIASVMLQYKKIIDGFIPDIIHAHKLGSNTEIAKALSRRTNCPTVFTLHGETTCEEPWKSRPKYIERALKGADRVVCVSSALRRRVETFCRKDIDVILNGFSIQNLATPEKKDGLILNQTGYLVPSKRVDVTLKAFSKILEKHPEARLSLVGDGVQRKKLEEISEDLGVAPAVTFHGYVLNKEAIPLMCKARFFIMASKPEGFGIVYLEAMASGCITVGTEGEGISDLIRNGENGFLVPADDPEAIVHAVEWCLAHEEEAKKIAEQGRVDALALTWEKNASEYLEIFEKMIRKDC